MVERSAEDERRQVFDRLFADGADPWGFETSDYERAKFDATIAALGDRRFGHALEIGCAFGVLSERLAVRCGRLTALDVSGVAVTRALERAGASGFAKRARFLRAEVPGEWPAGCYDLVVLSEVLYFLDPHEVDAVARLCARDLAPDGTCLVVNWTGANDRPLDGNAAARRFLAGLGALRRGANDTHRADGYRLDVWEAR